MEDDGKFSRNRDFGFANAAAFGNAHPSCFERGPFRNACKQDIGSLEEIAAQ